MLTDQIFKNEKENIYIEYAHISYIFKDDIGMKGGDRLSRHCHFSWDHDFKEWDRFMKGYKSWLSRM